MKILVLGATGMAGHTISIYFKERGHEVIAYSIKPFPYCENIIGDAFDTQKLKCTLLEGRYDVVINCIGLLNSDAEDNHSKSVFLNSYLPHFIADVLIDANTKLIHMSTDCVFAGNSGPYYENSFRDGLTFYDRTKALGEVEDNKNLTFRNSILGPDMNKSGIGLFNWFMIQNTTLKGFTGALWTGVTTLTLAKAMEEAIEENTCGLYNLVNNESISKYDLLCIFNKYFKNNQIIIEREDDFLLDKSLRNTRSDFQFIIPSYDLMIREMKIWIDEHSQLYPHYK